MNAISQPWIPVFTGPVWRALAVQSRLETAGFTTYVPDRNLRTLDPFATGGDAFSLEVMVPADSVEAAAREVTEAEMVWGPPASSAAADENKSTSNLVRWMRWSAVLLPPLGVIEGFAYLRRVRKSGVRPAEHRFNLITIGLAVVLTVVWLLMYGAFIAHQGSRS